MLCVVQFSGMGTNCRNSQRLLAASYRCYRDDAYNVCAVRHTSSVLVCDQGIDQSENQSVLFSHGGDTCALIALRKLLAIFLKPVELRWMPQV